MLLNVNTLRQFLEHSKYKLYFAPDPFLRGGESITINSIEDSILMSIVNDFNQARSDDSSDIVL